MQLTTLRRLLLDELQEMYIAELLIEEALPRMEKGADASKLKAALSRQHQQAKLHTERLDEVCSRLNTSPRGGRGISVKALLRETEDRLGEGGDADVMDAALIVAARRLEHWAIASYGTAQLYATALQQEPVAALLGKTLEEKQAADLDLSRMAANVQAREKGDVSKEKPAESA